MQLDHVLDIIDRPAAWSWIRRQYLPGGVVCPGCGVAVTGRLALISFESMKRTYCASCGSTFQAKAAVAILRGTEWQPEEYVKLILLHLAGIVPAQIAKLLGKSVPCVRGMLDRVEIISSLAGNGAHPLPGHQLKG